MLSLLEHHKQQGRCWLGGLSMAALGGVSGKGCLHCIEVATVGISFSDSSGNKIPELPTPSAQSGQNTSLHRALHNAPSWSPVGMGAQANVSLICISGKN